MQTDFWIQRWDNNQIGFHENEANALLVAHFDKLLLKAGDRVFLPLCGKTSTIPWLLNQGFRVVGAELARTAIEQLFQGLEIAPEISQVGKLEHFRGPNIDMFVGDVFELSSETLGPVQAVYDRAALVALPLEMRKRYAAHLIRITRRAPQLLITFLYDQAQMPGPPFSISDEELESHYGEAYQLHLLEGVDVPNGLKGQVAASENIRLLSPR